MQDLKITIVIGSISSTTASTIEFSFVKLQLNDIFQHFYLKWVKLKPPIAPLIMSFSPLRPVLPAGTEVSVSLVLRSCWTWEGALFCSATSVLTSSSIQITLQPSYQAMTKLIKSVTVMLKLSKLGLSKELFITQWKFSCFKPVYLSRKWHETFIPVHSMVLNAVKWMVTKAVCLLTSFVPQKKSQS